MSLQGRFGVSERRACRLTRQHRSSQRYRRRLVPEEALLRQRLQLLARRHPRYGYRRIHAILRREGWACNRKRVQRLWRGRGTAAAGQDEETTAWAADARRPDRRSSQPGVGDRLRLRPDR